MIKQGKFSGKGKAILSPTKPTGLGDFLSEQLQSAGIRNQVYVNTDMSQNIEPVYQRLELKLPNALAEDLRVYAFEQRITKTATVIEALQTFLASRKL